MTRMTRRTILEKASKIKHLWEDIQLRLYAEEYEAIVEDAQIALEKTEQFVTDLEKAPDSIFL
jgi:hypothetical protein